jgi:hypothetical protein
LATCWSFFFIAWPHVGLCLFFIVWPHVGLCLFFIFWPLVGFYLFFLNFFGHIWPKFKKKIFWPCLTLSLSFFFFVCHMPVFYFWLMTY